MHLSQKFIVTLSLVLIFISISLSSQYKIAGQIGYNNGPGFQLNSSIANFANNFPLKLRLGLSYASASPGNSADARRIFINDATNGSPEKKGWMWNFRFDLLYPINIFSLKNAYIYGGPRYSMFTANFKYIGGNEDFDVTSNQWGLGAGINNSFRMTGNWNFVVNTGLDYYISSQLTGHDTMYSPDGEHSNPRRDYGYSDADDAIDQPKLIFHFLFGVEYSF